MLERKTYNLQNTKNVIKAFIESYVITHQEEIKYHMKQLKLRQKELKSETGSSSDLSLRHSLSIPTDLFIALKKQIPEFDKFLGKKENVHWIMRNFLFLSVPKKV